MTTHEPDIELEVMTYDECLTQLKGASIGRLAWNRGTGPVVVPVNYAWDGEAVVFRSDPGAKVAELHEQRAAFEIDEIDANTHTGWSVLVVGTAHETEPGQWPTTAQPVEDLHLYPWAPGSKSRWLRLQPANVSGRRLVAHAHVVRNPFWRLTASD